MRILPVVIALIFVSHSLIGQEVLAPSKVIFTRENGNAIIIENYAFTTCIDSRVHIPLWVSHAISKELIDKGRISRDRPAVYSRDPQYLDLKKNAYASSGYDHGHMAPARDFKWNSGAWWESFYMTNMAPQHGCFNQKGWCHLESHCRKWAVTDSLNVIYIVTGIIPGDYIDTLCYTNDFKIFVPLYFFKAVLSYKKRSRTGKAIGFIMPNESIDNAEIEAYATTIDKIESLSGLDLFSFLKNSIEDQLESEVGDFDFYELLECPDKDCESIYSGNRTRPEDRTKLWCD